MSLWSPLRELHYDERDDDLVRYLESSVDAVVASALGALCDALREGDELRQELSEDDTDLLLVFARRRTLHALREGSASAVDQALDAYSLISREEDVPWESWFKAALVIGRERGLDVATAQRRFAQGALEALGQRADVAFDALARVDSLAQCHVIEVHTSYGLGLIETTVVRDQGVRSWGGITGQPVALGQFRVGYAPTTNLAQWAVTIADALETSHHLACSSIRQDQLVGATFDLVTSGSYLDSSGCLSFFADGAEGRTSFCVVVAEIPSEEHYDLHYDAEDLVTELADAANAIEEQSALALGPCVVVMSALPSFDEEPSDEVIDLSEYLEVARTALGPAPLPSPLDEI